MESIVTVTWSGRVGCVLTAALLSGACNDDIAEGGGGGSGTITDEWRAFCVAVFGQDYAVKDAFGEDLFTARAGEEYLLTDYGQAFGEDQASMAYLTSAGPYEFEITAPANTRDFPFTTTCEFDNSAPYYAVFTNVSVYAASDLATKLCDLPAGTVRPRDVTVQAGYSATTLDLNSNSTYEVFLNAFSADCGGAQTGFISVPPTHVLGSTTHLPPIIAIIGPRE